MSKTVRNAEGKYLGRLSMTAELSWVGPAHAYCFEDSEVEAFAAKHGGEVAPVPVFTFPKRGRR